MRCLHIQVLRQDASQDSNLPSQFYADEGSDGASFVVVESATRCEVLRGLRSWCDDVLLTRYSETDRTGYFRVVDEYAPLAGVVLELLVSACDSKCVCKGRFVFASD